MTQVTWYVSCIAQLSRCRKSGLVRLPTWRLASLQEKPGIRIYFFFHMQLKFRFSSISHLWLHYLVFSSGKPVNAAMENVRKSINRHDLFYDCVSHKVFILTIANGLFDLWLWVVLLYWASCVLPQVSDWKWPLGGAVEQAPEQSRGVEKVIIFFSSLWYCDYCFTILY